MLFRLAVRGVLCFVGALSHDVEYKLGDSSGCETTTGWVSVDSYWECHAAMDRIDRFTTGDQSLGTFVKFVAATTAAQVDQGNDKGCYYQASNTGYLFKTTYMNKVKRRTNLVHTVGLQPALPYCKKLGAKVHKNHVLFLGGTKIDDWKTTSEEFPGSYNLGKSKRNGPTTRLMLNNMLKFFEPSVVVLDCGEQDLDNGLSVRKSYRHVKRITQIILNHHAALVYLGTRPEPQKTTSHEKYRKLDLCVKRLVRRLADDVHYMHDHKTIAMIDVHKNFMDAGNPRDLYTFDGLQLSLTAYKRWTSWTQAALHDSHCLVWGDGKCKRRRTMSPLSHSHSMSPLSSSDPLSHGHSYDSHGHSYNDPLSHGHSYDSHGHSYSDPLSHGHSYDNHAGHYDNHAGHSYDSHAAAHAGHGHTYDGHWRRATMDIGSSDSAMNATSISSQEIIV